MPPKKKRVVHSTSRHSSSNVSQDPLSDTSLEWEEDLDDTTADPTVKPELKQTPGEGVQTRAQAALAAEQLASAAVAQVTAGLPPTPARMTRATTATGAILSTEGQTPRHRSATRSEKTTPKTSPSP